MTHDKTIQELLELRMLRDWLTQPPTHGMTFEEKLALLVDREWTDRYNRALDRRIKEARLPMQATVDDVWREPGRGADRPQLRTLESCQWIPAKPTQTSPASSRLTPSHSHYSG